MKSSPLNKHVRLQLWGTLPEITKHPSLFESAVVLHANPKFDLELTLERGRIFLANTSADKKPVHVRLRFEKEIWDVTLAEPGSEIGVDLFRNYTRDIDWQNGEAPRAEAKFCLLAGTGGLQVDYRDYPNLAMPGPAIFFWDNKGEGLKGPIALEKPLIIWSREPPPPLNASDKVVVDEVREAFGAVSQRLNKDKPVKVMFSEVLSDDNSPARQRYVSICGLCAIDDIPTVLDVLENGNEARLRTGWQPSGSYATGSAAARTTAANCTIRRKNRGSSSRRPASPATPRSFLACCTISTMPNARSRRPSTPWPAT